MEININIYVRNFLRNMTNPLVEEKLQFDGKVGDKVGEDSMDLTEEMITSRLVQNIKQNNGRLHHQFQAGLETLHSKFKIYLIRNQEYS